MVPLLPLRDGVRALPISFFRQSMPSFYMNAPDCICSPGRLPLGAFCTGRDGRYEQDWPTRCAFQSTHPVRGATPMLRRSPAYPCHFNPRAPCGARQDLPAVLKPVAAISIYAPHGRGGVSAGRPAGQRFLRPGPSCAYRARFDCRSGTMRRGRTGCRCSWTYPTHPIERNRTHRTAGHTWRSR